MIAGSNVEKNQHSRTVINIDEISETRLYTDVLVIGGGIAGCFAAIKAKEQGVDVILVDKGYVGRSGQSPYATGFMAFNPDWGHDFDAWMDYINKTSEYVNNRDWTEITIKESYARFQDLVSWGVEFVKDEKGEYDRAKVPPGVTELIRIPRDADPHFMQIMRRQVLKRGINILDRMMITELLKQDQQIIGAVGTPVNAYHYYSILAKTTILCVGACGFKPAGYPPIVQLTCDGEAMGYRAGAEILGKEYVDTHTARRDSPIGIPNMLGRIGNVPEELTMLLGPGRRAPEVNAEGVPIPTRPDGASKYRYTYLEYEFEALQGKVPIYTPTENGYEEVIGGACLGMSLRKADGLWPVDLQCRTSLPGLFAAGDSLGNSQNGAVYALSGSSLAGSAVTGTIAGVASANQAIQGDELIIDERILMDAKHQLFAPVVRKAGYSPRWVTQLLQNTMMPYFISFIKRADRLQATLTMIEYFQNELIPKLFARDAHELRLALETKNMMLSAEMRLRSALFRTESRGNHYREDHPMRDDENWLAWTKIVLDDGKMKLSKVPVPLEWHPDTDMVYEEKYPFRFPGEER